MSREFEYLQIVQLDIGMLKLNLCFSFLMNFSIKYNLISVTIANPSLTTLQEVLPSNRQ
jgi:hypothetical protein